VRGKNAQRKSIKRRQRESTKIAKKKEQKNKRKGENGREDRKRKTRKTQERGSRKKTQKNRESFFLTFLSYCEGRGEKKTRQRGGFAINFESNVRLVFILVVAVNHFSGTCKYLF